MDLMNRLNELSARLARVLKHLGSRALTNCRGADIGRVMALPTRPSARVWQAVFPALALYLCSACNNFSEQRYATFGLAMELGTHLEDPLVLHATSVPDNLPGIVPYASVHGNFGGGTEKSRAQLLLREAYKRELEPDVIIYLPRGTAYAGSTSQYVGFGAAISTPVYRPQATANCYRLSPIGLGLRWDDNQMVVFASDLTKEASGILEGDTLISINSRGLKGTQQSLAPIYSEVLRMKIGQRIKLIWIRPGTGRMEGEVTATAPRPIPSTIASFVKPYEPRPYSTASSRTSGQGKTY